MALPPGPRAPSIVTSVRFLHRPLDRLRQWQAEYGDAFTIRFTGFSPGVYVSDPTAIRELLTGDQSDLLAGEANSFLTPVLGPNSVLVLDGPRHLRQRKLLLPPFQGSHVAEFRRIIRDAAEREVDRWRAGDQLVLRARMRTLTFDVICRAVFGVTEPARVERLRDALCSVIDASTAVLLVPGMQRDLGPWSPGGKLIRRKQVADAMLYEEISRRRGAPDLDERTDVLSLLLRARDEDGNPLTDEELRDELFTMLAAGHETTATALSFTFDLLMRRPEAYARVREAVAAGDDAYLDATAKESLRLRPVIDAAERTLTKPRTVAGLGPARGHVRLSRHRARPSPAGPLPRARGVPPRAVPRRHHRVLRVAALRRGDPALHRRGARAGGDGGGAARHRRARGVRTAPGNRGPGRDARDHARPEARCARDGAQGAAAGRGACGAPGPRRYTQLRRSRIASVDRSNASRSVSGSSSTICTCSIASASRMRAMSSSSSCSPPPSFGRPARTSPRVRSSSASRRRSMILRTTAGVPSGGCSASCHVRGR
ncbi:cytochrome P450 [Svornostia abyssi]|uniref:Cytochrome P450 n=1 Tax=Svornostia abyssi TaxID=2898438 RepID=A0ABY5PA74_9ACTN|nr:cytochrome P450 [Parviterribacteraceae bacterium J379]